MPGIIGIQRSLENQALAEKLTQLFATDFDFEREKLDSAQPPR
jgi:hypothetical protein